MIQIVYTLHCDTCSNALGDPDYECEFHYATRQEALDAAHRSLWRQLRDGRLECADCGDRVECLDHGHDWAPWTEQLTILGPSTATWSRQCRRCTWTEHSATAPSPAATATTRRPTRNDQTATDAQEAV